MEYGDCFHKPKLVGNVDRTETTVDHATKKRNRFKKMSLSYIRRRESCVKKLYRTIL